MTVEFVIGIARQAIEMTLLLAMPMLGVGLVVGLVMGIFQSVTQIQEMTLAFVPKILAVLIAIIVAGPWILSKLINFTNDLITNIPNYIR